MVSPQIFNIRILILLSCPCALSELRFWIILPISSAENVTKDRHLSLMSLRFAKSFLLLLISDHWFEKKSLKSPGLRLKPEIWNNSGISGIPYCLRIISVKIINFLKFFFVFCNLLVILILFFFRIQWSYLSGPREVSNDVANKHCHHFDENIGMLSLFL